MSINRVAPSGAALKPYKMKSLKKVNFKAHIVREYSCIPTVDQLGEADCSMEMFIDDDADYGMIEWIIEYPDGCEDVEHIGLWFDKKRLTDYDGLFSLPKEAIKLIRKCGFTVPRDF